MRSQENSVPQGHKKETLINWYLQDLEKHSEMELSLPELKMKSRLIKAILERLITLDNILLVVGNDDQETKQLLKVHPNYNPEDELSVMDDQVGSQLTGTGTEEETASALDDEAEIEEKSEKKMQRKLREPIGSEIQSESIGQEMTSGSGGGDDEKGGSLTYEFSGSEPSGSQSSTRSKRKEHSSPSRRSPRKAKRQATGPPSSPSRRSPSRRKGPPSSPSRRSPRRKR